MQENTKTVEQHFAAKVIAQQLWEKIETIIIQSLNSVL